MQAHGGVLPVAEEVAVSVTPLRAAGPVHRAVTGVLTGLAALRIELQPIVALSSGEVWGVEALARFPGHPKPGPDAWFAAALRDGRGSALEHVALRGAIDLLPRLPEAMRLTVNVSARSLLLPAVHGLLLDAAGPRLVVELTEHEEVRDYPALLDALTALREAGVALCIDDVGAGHSSLRHVLHLEPDVLKLDLALVQGVAGSTRQQALLAAMVAFCRSTETMLVAEGVEAPDDLLRLVDLGVGHAQGWFLARPAEADVVLPLLTGTLRPPVLVL